MDPSWCPGCDRLILPKRYVVPVNPAPPPPPQPESLASSDAEQDPNHPPPPPAPTPVPSSPEVRKKPLADPARAAPRVGATRARAHGLGGGLVHGTGRVRPGGGLKPRPAATPKRPMVSPPKPARDATAVLAGNPTAQRVSTADPYFPPAPLPPAGGSGRKTRVVISQEPTPLYCSDECRARDLKNSFLDSESLSFVGAPAALHHAAQMERVEQTVEHVMKIRRASASSDKSARQALPALPLPIPTPIECLVEEASLPPVPPNTYVEPPHKMCRAMSSSSTSSTSTASSSRLPPSESKNSTIRGSSSQPRSRAALPIRSGSFSMWGSPSKAALAPPTHTHYTAGSSSSLESTSSCLSGGSAIFDDDGLKLEERRDGEETCATTPSRRGSGSSGASKKAKRVSFASDSKPPNPPQPSSSLERPRRQNPLLDANPLRDAVSVSPKDRVQAASLPSDLLPPSPSLRTSLSQSSPSLVVDSPAQSRYGVAMWPEDEKRTTESARQHGVLLRGYAKSFAPREGRSLVWGRLWDCRAEEKSTPPASVHEAQPDSRREYWRAFEEREAEARARRKAAAAVQREEEERVIGELLGGAGMRDEDQPQARRMKQMAYDGMPGPAELRGLTYKFNQFLYPLMQPKPTIVEKTVRRWDEDRHEWIEETTREEVYQERKRLFNFVEDS